MPHNEKIFEKANEKFSAIDNLADLQKHKLSYSDYNVVYDGMKKLSTLGDAEFVTFCKGAADWFRRNKFTVRMDEHGINYIITY